MSHSPYLNHTSAFGHQSRSFGQSFDQPHHQKQPPYMHNRDRFMESDPKSQLMQEPKKPHYVITPLNILSAGLCIAAFGLGVAWFGWPDRVHLLLEDIGVKKIPAEEVKKSTPPAIEIDEGFYSADLKGIGFLIPGENLRHIHRDDAGKAQRIDLITKLDGAKAPSKSQDILPSTDKNKVFISLSDLSSTMTPQTRLETTYKHHLADEGVSTSLGLTLYRFNAETGYGDQELYTGTLPSGSYVSVCFDEMAGLNASRCLASVNIGQNLVARYNFDRSYISNWQDINSQVRTKVIQMRVSE